MPAAAPEPDEKVSSGASVPPCRSNGSDSSARSCARLDSANLRTSSSSISLSKSAPRGSVAGSEVLSAASVKDEATAAADEDLFLAEEKGARPKTSVPIGCHRREEASVGEAATRELPEVVTRSERSRRDDRGDGEGEDDETDHDGRGRRRREQSEAVRQSLDCIPGDDLTLSARTIGYIRVRGGR